MFESFDFISYDGKLTKKLGLSAWYEQVYTTLVTRNFQTLQSVSWSLAEFRHNKIVQSPHENYFNVCRQHKEK